ncbi:hypothetical protein DPMN_188127 [Dreissena polymorpha]|uniref:Uncharacterized protein n=1 Tax=Dreissena polymorpha TaxID=45954 RepID=A0A9D4I9N1_DREPO|nr:hypothetical protein DPMN_188127 [Dreissena polymorpha]
MISANKMLVNRKDLPDFPNGTCELAVVDIDLGILNEATTRITRFNSAFQSPSITWRGVSIKKQVPKYLPMNLWPGNIIVFGCLEAQSQVPHFSVTLAGKIGLEEVRIAILCF